jgi:hypothetical protein
LSTSIITGIETRLDAQDDDFCRCNQDIGRQDVVGQLHRLRRAGFLADVERPTDRLEHRSYDVEFVARARHHDGKCPLFGPADAATDRAVDRHDVPFGEQVMDLHGCMATDR